MTSEVALRAFDQHRKYGLPLPAVGADRLENHLAWESVAIRADIRELAQQKEQERSSKMDDAKARAAELLAQNRTGPQ